MLYLDTAATTPVDPRVADVVLRHMTDEFGNAGSRTHEWGTRAKRALASARESLADTLAAQPDEVIFTSGATESDNLALLGMARHGQETGRRHILSSATEHKAVLEPLEQLAARGFDVELLAPDETGRFSADEVLDRVRPDTLLVSLMQVNNETGVVQPIEEIATALLDTATFVHVDAAQGFAKVDPAGLALADLVSVSGHKIAAPKGIGALVVRRRGWKRIPLEPLMYGGGQERKLRPGTVPVALAVGLSTAAVLLRDERETWAKAVTDFRSALLGSLEGVAFEINGDPAHAAPHIINVSLTGVDSEALVVAMKDTAAVATGSACTSASYAPSHVLVAMGLPESRVLSAVRLSWWSDTDASLLPGLRAVVDGVAC